MNIFRILASVIAFMAIASCAQTAQTDYGNQVIETIMARRSIRQYKPVAVSRDTLQTILECGINAPNGMNAQSWEVRVVDDPVVMERIIDAMAAGNPDVPKASVKGCFRNAPVMIFIANALSYDCSQIDCGLLSENIMLSAWSLGVGSVCLGSPIRFLKNSQEALGMLGFSEGYDPVICIGLGYASESPDAKPRDWNKVKFID